MLSHPNLLLAFFLDKFRVESRLFDRPVVLACRDDHVVEVYVVDEGGLEVYFGRLDQLERGGSNQAKINVLLEAVGRRVREKPVSARSLAWLSALDAARLLQ
jgi:hypothetical protein